ncbi:hypothetical protein [Streptomyces lateritius]|uniref:hypothetical protein n=1 Tax=Streptomyces lateritius TaxID=67313 RepID=UPI001C8BAFA1|nr:hypothetical protein [Streptomyces lateritius]MBX9425415.1 hypothetical protein [Streptomyces lateritius]
MDALTHLVQAHVGEGRPLRIRQFADRAVDPETGWTPSKSLVGNIVAGHQVKVTPAIIRAVAAGLGVPLCMVQTAAAEQYLGLVLKPEGAADD